jgi:hypothetical protein
LDADSLEGNGNGTIRYTCKKNYSIESRTAIITIKAGNTVKEVSIIQEGLVVLDMKEVTEEEL